jgi:hypothetical protein
MPVQKRLAKIHFFSTSWFFFCMCYILLFELQKYRVNWWIVFSFSSHGIILLLFLLTLYLFAIFRGISSSQKLDEEHPLSRTTQYAIFYVLTPFLGSLAGLFTITGADTIGTTFLVTSLGALAATFLVWVIIDPVIGLLEVMTPAGRKHRSNRLAAEKADREQKHLANQRLLAEIEEKEESNRRCWQSELRPQAEKLAELLINSDIDSFEAERQAAEIAVQAWQTGGISCMREVRDMAMSISREKSKNDNLPDFIQYWWDGIGNWRSPLLGSD